MPASSSRRPPAARFRAPAVLAVLAALLAVLRGSARADAGTPVVDLWPDGSKRESYELDPEGRKHGPYQTWHENGQLAMKAAYDADRLDGLVRTWDASGAQRTGWTYKRGVLNGAHKTYDEKGRLQVHKTYRNGILHGAWKDYHANRRLKLSTTYRDGKLHGAWHLRAADGSTRIKTTYKHGLRDGKFRAFDGKRTITKQKWRKRVPVDVDGLAPYPRKASWLAAELTRLLEGDGAVSEDRLEADRELALRYLKAYRCISGVPYEDVTIDAGQQAHAQAAAAVCRDLGHITHFPENPGWESARFDFAAIGTKSSNLAQGRIACESVRAYMDDSDARNIAKVGHRAWCMNPAMAQTGFGTVDHFSAMWSIDRGRKDTPDYDIVACPPPGKSPGAWFGTHWAWSVSMNPKHYDAPKAAQIKVSVTPVDETFLPTAPALALNHLSVLTKSAGIPYMIVFRPVGFTLTEGSRYRVTVEGLTRKGKPRPLRYFVEFFDHAYAQPVVPRPGAAGKVLSR